MAHVKWRAMQLAIAVATLIALPRAGFSQIAHRVKDINETASAAGSTFATGVTIGTVTYFGADDGLNGFEFWRTDGRTAGTWLVKDLQPGRFGSNAGSYRIFNGKVFFTANNGLYSSDGTAEGTVRIATASTSFSPTVVDNRLFFAASDVATGTELWVTDGTTAGTRLVMDINPGAASGIQFNTFVSANGLLYFIGNDSQTGYELWKSDGTAAGTALVKDIAPGSASSNPNQIVNANSVVFFRAFQSTTGSELWKTDGTDTGTELVIDLVPGAGSSFPNGLVALGGAHSESRRRRQERAHVVGCSL